MKRNLFIVSFLICTIHCAGQRFEQYYDYKWRPVPVDRALFFSITEVDGNRFHRRDYYIREDKLLMDGYFADVRCTIKQGAFFYYYPSGNLELICNNINNKLQGVYLSFYENGMLNDSSLYFNGSLIGNSFAWHQNGMMKDSIRINNDGSGVSVSWHQNGMPSAAGYYAVGQKMRGTWQYFHSNGKPSARELYDNGNLVEKKYFDEVGLPEKDTTSTDQAASFAGGDIEWKKHVSKYAHIPDGWLIGPNDSITVVVTATIDEEGRVTNAYVSAPFHPAFDQVALRLVLLSPRWLPAISHHRKIREKVKLPVTFSRAG